MPLRSNNFDKLSSLRVTPKRKTAPVPDGPTGLRALRAMLRQQSPLAALELFHHTLGDVFQVNLPGFTPILLVGPEANRFVLVEARDALQWRSEQDPIAKLLNRGLLVIDGEQHDRLRRLMTPAFHRRMLQTYVEAMWQHTDQIGAAWPPQTTIDMLDQMRRVTLLILMKTMFRVDFTPEMERLWGAVLKTLDYIAPGPWLIWPGLVRPGYDRALRQLDDYLRRLIQARRAVPAPSVDLLGLLVAAPEVSDDLIRDQMFTMLIAGHDTSTVLLAWALYLLGKHPAVQRQAQTEIDRVLGTTPPTFENLNDLAYLSQVINETLRLYPPLHLGLRITTTDLEFQGYHLPQGRRVMYSPYLTHRHPDYWPNPTKFNPDRFAGKLEQPPYTFVPFGGGPRICLGAAFAQVEAKVILARLLQRFHLTLVEPNVHMHMGVTIEPRPGVMMRVARR